MKRLLNLNTLFIVAIIIAVSALFIPRVIEIFNLQAQGITYFTTDIENYYNNAHPIEEEFSIEIDLKNLEINSGKELFDDGENRIYLSRIISHNAKDFELFFRSSGSYSLGGATLVSGLKHKHNNDGIISDFQAEGTAMYMKNTIKLSPTVSSGLKYLDGDEFGFQLELPEPIASETEGDVLIDVVITNLYLNLWAKKSF
jgi:hypothetical protein